MMTPEEQKKVQSAVTQELAHLGRVKTLLEIENADLKSKIKRLEAIDNALEVRLLEAFAHALNVEDATGWTTGIAIRDFLFRNGKWT